MFCSLPSLSKSMQKGFSGTKDMNCSSDVTAAVSSTAL